MGYALKIFYSKGQWHKYAMSLVWCLCGRCSTYANIYGLNVHGRD